MSSGTAAWLGAAALIEFAGSLLIVAYALAALAALARHASIDDARERVARGAILGLDLKMAATLLKTLALADWQSIAMFVGILALRTLLKRSFTLDLAGSRRPR